MTGAVRGLQEGVGGSMEEGRGPGLAEGQGGACRRWEELPLRSAPDYRGMSGI